MDFLENIKDEIKIPKGVDFAIQKGIERGRREKKFQKPVKRYKSVAAAAAIFIGIVTFAVSNPHIVKAIPIVQSIFKMVGYGSSGESFEKFEQFSTSISKTVEKNGIKITVDQVAIDDNMMAITLIEEGKNLKIDTEYMGAIKLNGKLVSTRSSRDKRIDDNKIVTVTTVNISDLNLSKDVNVDMDIVWYGETRGPWDFKFKVSKADKPTNSKIVNLDKTIKIPNSTLKIDNIVVSPLGNTLNYSGIYDKTNATMENNIIDIMVLNDKGKIMQTKFAGSSSNKERYGGKLEILNDLNNIKSLTIVPVFKQWGIKMLDINNFPYPILQTTINSTNFNIPQETVTKSRPVTKKEKSSGYALDTVTHMFNIDRDGKFSSIEGLIGQTIKVGSNSYVLIKNIEATESETKITFKIEGSGAYNYRNIDQAVIIDESYNDFEIAESGDRESFEDADEGIVSIKLPPIDRSKKYKIALPIIDEPQIDEQYKINIELNK